MMMARKSDRFEQVLRRGHYLFHLHTDWTDGQSSLYDYCIAAKRLGFQALVLTEHIRRECGYDFRGFLESANEQQSIHDMEILVGVEAKILPSGLVDVPEEILPEIEILAIAEHGFQEDALTLVESLNRAFESLRDTGFACVWVHPGLGLLLKKNLSESAFQEILQVALECGVYIEDNLRYKLPPKPLLPMIPPTCAVVGLDAHSVEEVEKLAEEALQKEGELISAIWSKRGTHEDR